MMIAGAAKKTRSSNSVLFVEILGCKEVINILKICHRGLGWGSNGGNVVPAAGPVGLREAFAAPVPTFNLTIWTRETLSRFLVAIMFWREGSTCRYDGGPER